MANLVAGMGLTACDSGSSNSGPGTKPGDAIEVTLAYSSEKQPWIEPLANQFNKEKHPLPRRQAADLGDSDSR